MAKKSETVKVEATPVKPSKKNSGMKWLIGGCLLLLLCLCVCCFSFFFFFGTLTKAAFRNIDEINEEVLNDICNASEGDLREVYDENFTANYKRTTSFTEFRSFYRANRDFFGSCSNKLEDLDFRDFLNGFSFNYQNANGQEVVDLTITIEDETLELKAVLLEDEWKVDELNVVRD